MSHLIAAAYLLIGSVAVVIVEARLGYQLVTIFGLQYQEKTVYPVAFWVLTFGYAWIAGQRRRLERWQWMARAIVLGFWVHLNLLAVTMAYESEMLPRLNARYFLYYVFAVIGLVTAASCVVSAVAAAAYKRGWDDEFWLPAVYLPLVHIVLAKSYGPLVAVFAAAALAVALMRLDGVHQRVVSFAKAVYTRLATGPVLIVLIVLVGLTLRLVAAERLGSMGIRTILTNADDPDQYHSAALKLLKGQHIGKYSSVGYNVCLFALYWLTGAVVPRALLIQAIIASSIPIAVYLIGARLFDRATGIVAALLAALSQILLFNSVNLAREVAGSVFTTWGMFCIVELLAAGESRRAFLWAVAAGAVFGVMMPIDPVFMVITLCLLGGYVLCMRFSAVHRLKIAAIGAGLAIAIATAIVWFAVGEMSPYARPNEPQLAIHLSKDFNPYALQLYERRINVIAYPTEFVGNVLAQPADAVRLTAAKIWLDARRFLFEAHAGFFDPLLLVHWSFMASNLVFYGYLFGFIGALAGLRGVLIRPVMLERAAVYLVILCYSSVFIVLFFGMTRFRVPVQPLLLVLVAFGMTSVFREAIRRSLARFSHADEAMRIA